MTHHDCARIKSNSPSATNDGKSENEPVGETGDTSWQPKLHELTYAMLRDLWAPHGTVPMARLKEDMWVQVVCMSKLCSPWLQGGRYRSFGEDINDLTRLSDALADEFPRGVAVVHLDKNNTTVCVPGHVAELADVTSALSWLRMLRGQAFGLALRSVGDHVQGAFLEVQFEPRGDRDETYKRRRAILKAVAKLIVTS